MARASSTRSNFIIKVVVALVVIAGLGFLFIRSVRETRSAPYSIPAASLRNWTVAPEPASASTAPMLVLQPPAEPRIDLFRQIFSRAMESLNAPPSLGMPLVLRGEFDAALSGLTTPEALAGAARDAGLETAVFEARCLALRRIAEPGNRRQLYFMILNAPAFERFRTGVAGLGDGAAGRAGFDPAALSPMLFVGASDPDFDTWLPLRANPEADCVAPILTE
jgi:hypothetical protein